MRGKFISLEGSDASGKSTNIQVIADFLKAQHIPFVLTHEPGGTPLAEALRTFLLNMHDEKIASKTELLLMFAARAQHIDQLIEPTLASGKWIICSRFTDSTFAYQGGGRGVAEADICLLEKLVQGTLQPDLTLLLDLPVEIAMQRANKRGQLLDRIEHEDQDFFERIRSAYLKRAAEFPQRIRVIDASQTIEKVQNEIINLIAALDQSILINA